MPFQNGKHNGIAAPKSFPDDPFCSCHHSWGHEIRQARVSDFGVLALLQVGSQAMRFLNLKNVLAGKLSWNCVTRKTINRKRP